MNKGYELLDLKRVAKEYQISKDVVRVWVREEGLPRLMNTHKIWIRRKDLENFIDENCG